ncbi:hypothetical protein TSUD_76750 [Trifolium subterraneum]|uniref:Hydroxyproline-rich glycoprotein family protein n=1 Tax=Trifolium subterraneum TaxID=3900 RepID=A0A2Z6LSL8_TRISU|nr:hypothetical protein TSUD_76750 [Trifolium subterraneum]
MMRRVNDGNNTLDTINAAAFAIASSQNRVSQPSNQKKKWGNWLNITGCFGYQKNNRKRIGHAVLVPETTSTGADAATNAVNSTAQAPQSITLPFIAPPSSPASFFQSEPPSTAQSPVGLVSKTSVCASMYSPGGPNSIFAIGPYAHETQLVSPPVFSASSTAPFTPPPESVHLTTPSSPEVPFAQLFDSNNRNSETFQRFQISHHDFQNYQFQPGSPVGPLISPRSAISGASSPLPDEFQTVDTAKLLKLDKLSTYGKQKSNQSSGSITPDAVKSTATQTGFLPNHQWFSDVKISPCSNNRRNEISVNHRVSFELSAGKVPSSVENKPTTSSAWTRLISSKLKNSAAAAATDKEENVCDDKQVVTETLIDAPKQTKSALVVDDATVDEKDPQSLTLSSSTKEFNFSNAEGGDSPAPNIVADWWANEKVAGTGSGASKDWSFFPIIQPGAS